MGSQRVASFSKLLHGLALLIVFYPIRWMVTCLSWRQALGVGTLLGMLHALLMKDRLHRQIHQGLTIVLQQDLPAATIKRLVRHNLVLRYKQIIDSFFYCRLDEKLIERLVPSIEGRDHLDGALSTGKGVILLTSHFGAPGMLIAGLVFRGYRVRQVFTLTPQPQYRTWRWLERAIMQAKLRCWEHERVSFALWKPGMYLRPLYRKLLEGEIVVLYGDGARGQQFARVDFMGYPLALSVGPLRMAARAQVPVIPAFIVRMADDRHRIIIEDPIIMKNDAPASIQCGANQYASVLSRYIRAYPDHWFTWARLRPAAEESSFGLELSTGEADPESFFAYEKRQQA